MSAPPLFNLAAGSQVLHSAAYEQAKEIGRAYEQHREGTDKANLSLFD